MKDIQVTVIGSGSTYCPELVDGFIKARDELHLTRLNLMDIDKRKRTIVGNLCVRMLRAAEMDTVVTMTDNLEESLQGADFVVTQIRVGMLKARYLDETIPLKYDLIGQETTGIGGFFKALRQNRKVSSFPYLLFGAQGFHRPLTPYSVERPSMDRLQSANAPPTADKTVHFRRSGIPAYSVLFPACRFAPFPLSAVPGPQRLPG